jgi:hypothetical protein
VHSVSLPSSLFWYYFIALIHLSHTCLFSFTRRCQSCSTQALCTICSLCPEAVSLRLVPDWLLHIIQISALRPCSQRCLPWPNYLTQPPSPFLCPTTLFHFIYSTFTIWTFYLIYLLLGPRHYLHALGEQRHYPSSSSCTIRKEETIIWYINHTYGTTKLFSSNKWRNSTIFQ